MLLSWLVTILLQVLTTYILTKYIFILPIFFTYYKFFSVIFCSFLSTVKVNELKDCLTICHISQGENCLAYSIMLKNKMLNTDTINIMLISLTVPIQGVAKVGIVNWNGITQEVNLHNFFPSTFGNPRKNMYLYLLPATPCWYNCNIIYVGAENVSKFMWISLKILIPCLWTNRLLSLKFTRKCYFCTVIAFYDVLSNQPFLIL